MGMPSLGLRFNGRAVVCEFLASVPPREQRDKFRFIATRANRQAAVAVYRQDPGSDTGVFRAWAIIVLTRDADAVTGIAVYPDPTLMPVFGLPTQP